MTKNSLLKSLVTALCIFTLGGVSAAEMARPKPISNMTKMPAAGASVAAQVIECPDKLMNVNLSTTSTFTAPSGWAPKPTPTGFSSLTMVRSYHSVSANKMWCIYGKSSLPTSLRLTSISRPVPAGKSCVASAGFKFSCQ